jgi:hypothetical protein
VNEYLHLHHNIGTFKYAKNITDQYTEASAHNCNQTIHWIREQRLFMAPALRKHLLLHRLQQQVDRLFIILMLIWTTL